jgi:hypothetical protein
MKASRVELLNGFIDGEKWHLYGCAISIFRDEHHLVSNKYAPNRAWLVAEELQSLSILNHHLENTLLIPFHPAIYPFIEVFEVISRSTRQDIRIIQNSKVRPECISALFGGCLDRVEELGNHGCMRKK